MHLLCATMTLNSLKRPGQNFTHFLEEDTEAQRSKWFKSPAGHWPQSHLWPPELFTSWFLAADDSPEMGSSEQPWDMKQDTQGAAFQVHPTPPQPQRPHPQNKWWGRGEEMTFIPNLSAKSRTRPQPLSSFHGLSWDW